MKKGLISFLAGLSACTLLLSGCLPNTGESPESSAPPENAPAASETSGSSTEPGGNLELSMMVHISRSVVGESGFATGFYTALDNFAGANPNIKIQTEELEQSAYQTKINSLGAAGDLPDIYMMKGSWAATFVNNGWAQDITAELDAVPDWKNGFIKGAYDAVTKDGKIYGVPQESMTSSVVFYNADLWSEIGYDKFPETWAELESAVDKFKEKGIYPFVLGNKPNWPAESCWLSTLGDRFTGPEWTSSILDGSGAKFTDEAFVRSLKAFQDLALRGAFNPDINSIDDVEARTVYFNKKAAAIVDGTWFIPTLDLTAPDDVKAATKLAILPAVENGAANQKTASGGPAWFLALSNNVTAEERAAAVDLIHNLTDGRQADITASLGGVTAWANPNYDKTKVAELFTEYNEMMRDVAAVPIYDACMEGSVIETMNVGLQSLLIGEKTPEELAAEIQKEQDLTA